MFIFESHPILLYSPSNKSPPAPFLIQLPPCPPLPVLIKELPALICLEGVLSPKANYPSVSPKFSTTYISTENMLPNKGGITRASSLPTIAQTQSFSAGDVHALTIEFSGLLPLNEEPFSPGFTVFVFAV